jgi:hypothetical protein
MRIPLQIHGDDLGESVAVHVSRGDRPADSREDDNRPAGELRPCHVVAVDGSLRGIGRD